MKPDKIDNVIQAYLKGSLLPDLIQSEVKIRSFVTERAAHNTESDAHRDYRRGIVIREAMAADKQDSIVVAMFLNFRKIFNTYYGYDHDPEVTAMLQWAISKEMGEYDLWADINSTYNPANKARRK